MNLIGLFDPFPHCLTEHCQKLKRNSVTNSDGHIAECLIGSGIQQTTFNALGPTFG